MSVDPRKGHWMVCGLFELTLCFWCILLEKGECSLKSFYVAMSVLSGKGRSGSLLQLDRM